MTFAAVEIQRCAAALGFRADSLEKALRLLSLLEALRSHPFLRPRVALKGGTALNCGSRGVAAESAVRHRRTVGIPVGILARNLSSSSMLRYTAAANASATIRFSRRTV